MSLLSPRTPFRTRSPTLPPESTQRSFQPTSILLSVVLEQSVSPSQGDSSSFSVLRQTVLRVQGKRGSLSPSLASLLCRLLAVSYRAHAARERLSVHHLFPPSSICMGSLYLCIGMLHTTADFSGLFFSFFLRHFSFSLVPSLPFILLSLASERLFRVSFFPGSDIHIKKARDFFLLSSSPSQSCEGGRSRTKRRWRSLPDTRALRCRSINTTASLPPLSFLFLLLPLLLLRSVNTGLEKSVSLGSEAHASETALRQGKAEEEEEEAMHLFSRCSVPRLLPSQEGGKALRPVSTFGHERS